MFLKEIQKTKLRRLKLQRLFLLALRILIVIFIVLAFADPIFRAYTLGKGENLSKLGIVFIDDSFSMSARDTRGELFTVAREEQKQIEKLYSASDKLYFIHSSSLISPQEHSFSYEKSQTGLPDTSAGASGASFDISLAIQKTQEIILTNAYPINEIYIISDFQKINFSSPLFSLLERVKPNKLQDNSYYYLINLGSRVPNNISINSVDIKTKLIEPSREIRLTAALKNFNNYSVTGKQINLYVGSEIVSETIADLEPFERKEIEFSFKPSKHGIVFGYAELVQNNYQDDEIAKDNRFNFNLYVPDVYSVGIYSEIPESARYIKTVLGLSRVYNIKTLSSLSGLIKSETDMTYIVGKFSFSGDEINVISDYLKQGRGVFIFPSITADINNYNELFFKLDAFKLTPKTGDPINIGRTNAGRKFSGIDFQHPLLDGIFRNQSLTATDINPEIAAPDINSIFGILTGSNSSILMSINEKPFLIETKTPGSSLLFCAVSADMRMSDFPKNALFAPIITKSVAYLSRNVNLSSQPSIYNRDTLESNLSLASASEITNYFKEIGIKNTEVITDPGTIERIVLQNRVGTSLWFWFIILAVLLTIIDMYYSRKLSLS